MLHGPEVLFYLLNHWWQRVLVEVDHALQVQFCTQNIEENILAVAFVKLADLICKLIEHRKVLAGIIWTLYHRAHLIL